jgi:DNA repair exonuclease SbcCD ATPase subunit
LDVEPEEAGMAEIREQIRKEMEEKMMNTDSKDKTTFETIKGEAEDEAKCVVPFRCNSHHKRIETNHASSGVSLHSTQLQQMLSSNEHSETKKRRMSESMDGYSEELQERMHAIREKQKRKEQLSRQLQQMQQRVLKGNLLEETQLADQELLRNEEELEEQKLKEQERKQRIESLQNAKDQSDTTYTSLREEVNAKTKTMRKLQRRCQAIEDELMQAAEEFQEERESFWLSIRELEQKSELYDFLIEHFVPQSEVERVKTRAYWDERANTWRIDSISSPEDFNKVPELRSRHERCEDDVLQPDLDRPLRTTVPELDGQKHPQIQERIDAALQEDFEVAQPRPLTSKGERERQQSASAAKTTSR